MHSEVNIIGRVGSKGTIRATNSGSSLITLSIAVNKKYQSREGDWVVKTIWVRVTFWNKLADVVDKYVEKGDRIFVSGELDEPYAYEKNGELAATIQVTARSLVLIESREPNKDIHLKNTNDKDLLPSTEKTKTEDDVPF